MKSLFSTLLLLLGILSANVAQSLNIVTSIPPLNALAAGVAEGITEPKMLVPPEASHHHYTLKPSDRQALEQANVVIWISPDMEIFLRKPIGTLPKETTVITVLDLPQMFRLPMRGGENWEVHEHEHDHDGNVDPHVWLNPMNGIYITQILADTFSKLDAQNAVIYQKNAANMIKQIKALDQQLKTQLLPVKDKPFIVFHDAYQYFDHRYQLRDIGSISINTDLPPGAKRIYQLQERIKKEHLQCIFADVGITPAIVETLASQTKTKIGTLDSVGQGKSFADYLALLQYDADSVSNCLSRN